MTFIEVIYRGKDLIWGILESDDVAYPDGHRNPRKQRHNGTDKRTKDMQDIMNVYLELPLQSITTFLAKDLVNLPPITMKLRHEFYS